MSGCASFGADGPGGIGEMLRSIDCQTARGTAQAFERLFGGHGGLMPALTILLTLYVAWTAIGLLTGRARIGVATLTPRMLTLGAVLTFATSWAAYQSVVWTLLAGAPDQVAGLLLGTRGSATALFADRLDHLFGAVAQAAQTAQGAAGAEAKGWQPADLLWAATMLLLLGTAGILVTARIALAALLALGPVFLVLAIFRGTRGLFEGWLRAAVLFAVVPLFAVLIGGGAIVMLTPLAEGLGAEPTMQQAATVFLGAAVHCALMAMALKVAGQIVAGWRPGDGAGAGPPFAGQAGSRLVTASGPAVFAPAGTGTAAAGGDDRVRAIAAAAMPRPPAGPAPAAREAHPVRACPAGASLVHIGHSPRPSSPSGVRAAALGRAMGGAARTR